MQRSSQARRPRHAARSPPPTQSGLRTCLDTLLLLASSSPDCRDTQTHIPDSTALPEEAAVTRAGEPGRLRRQARNSNTAAASVRDTVHPAADPCPHPPSLPHPCAQMIPAGQQEPWLLPSVSHTPAVAAPVAAVQRIDFPHRALLADGTFGAVLPEFQAPLRSNPQGSLRKDVHLYDIILFIARGYSKQVCWRCCEHHQCSEDAGRCQDETLPSNCTTAPPHPLAASPRLLPRNFWRRAARLNPG